jgi:hypothetical protein
MATRWRDDIRNSGQLSVFPGPKVTGGKWDAVFNDALKQFNTLSSSLHLGVTLKKSVTPPDPTGPGGADVVFEAGSGTVSFMSDGQQFSVTTAGNDIRGDTTTAGVQFGTGPVRLTKAFILVPITPQISAKGREVGDGLKLVIAVHELIHACGLANADHDLGVFFSPMNPVFDKNPANDKFQGGTSQMMPPIFLSPKTVTAIQSLWVGP